MNNPPFSHLSYCLFEKLLLFEKDIPRDLGEKEKINQDKAESKCRGGDQNPR